MSTSFNFTHHFILSACLLLGSKLVIPKFSSSVIKEAAFEPTGKHCKQQYCNIAQINIYYRTTHYLSCCTAVLCLMGLSVYFIVRNHFLLPLAATFEHTHQAIPLKVFSCKHIVTTYPRKYVFKHTHIHACCFTASSAITCIPVGK